MRLNRSTGWRLAVAVAVPALMVSVGAAPAAAATSLQCHGYGDPYIEATYPGACFMGYFSVNTWSSWPIPITGGTAPYSVTLVSGNLPTGLALQPDGTVEGDPPLQQDSTFTVQVTDSSSPAESLTVPVAVQTWGGTPDPQVEATDNTIIPYTQEVGPALALAHDGFNGSALAGPTAQLLAAASCEEALAVWEVNGATDGLLGRTRPKPNCQPL